MKTKHARPGLIPAITLVLALSPAAVSASEDDDAQALQKDWSEAIETLKGYSVRQRDKALAKGRETLKAMDRRLEELEAQATEQWDELGAGARAQRQLALRTLRRQRNRLAEWYGGMQHSSADAWDDVKTGFVSAYDRLSESMGEAATAFSEEETSP